MNSKGQTLERQLMETFADHGLRIKTILVDAKKNKWSLTVFDCGALNTKKQYRCQKCNFKTSEVRKYSSYDKLCDDCIEELELFA